VADTGDIDIHGSNEAIVFLPVQGFAELFSGGHPPGSLVQIPKQFELGGGQIDGLVGVERFLTIQYTSFKIGAAGCAA
jgi:hypothetical protein